MKDIGNFLFQAKIIEDSSSFDFMPHALTLVYPGLSRYQWIKYSIPLRFCCDLAKLFPSSENMVIRVVALSTIR